MSIRTYRFHKERLSDPLMFAIPESVVTTFGTETIAKIIRDAGLRGFDLIDAERIGEPAPAPPPRQPAAAPPDYGGYSPEDPRRVKQPADIQEIEKQFSWKLPRFYADFLLNYPAKLEKLRPIGRKESVADVEIMNGVGALIWWNKDVRIPDTPWTEDGGPWPDKFFVTGRDLTGNYWAVNVTSDKPQVYFYDHETGKIKVKFRTLEKYVSTIATMYSPI